MIKNEVGDCEGQRTAKGLHEDDSRHANGDLCCWERLLDRNDRLQGSGNEMSVGFAALNGF